MGFDMLMPYLVAGTSLIAMGVGLVTLSSVATLRGFIQDEIASSLGDIRRKMETMDERITANHEALADHIEEAHSV